MSGQKTHCDFDFTRYYESMKHMCGPYSDAEIPKFKIDYKGLIAYADSQGKTVPELSDEEAEQFTYGVPMAVIRANRIKVD